MLLLLNALLLWLRTERQPAFVLPRWSLIFDWRRST